MLDSVRKRLPDGAAVGNYYPAVIPLALFQKAQEARRAFAQAKFGESFNAGKDLHSDKNLFKKLVFDSNNGAPMVFRQYNGFSCLVTTHRKNLRQHKISYALFEKIILNSYRVPIGRLSPRTVRAESPPNFSQNRNHSPEKSTIQPRFSGVTKL